MKKIILYIGLFLLAVVSVGVAIVGFFSPNWLGSVPMAISLLVLSVVCGRLLWERVYRIDRVVKLGGMNLLDHTPDLVSLKSPEGTFVWANRSFLSEVGLPLHSIVGRRERDLPWADYAPLYEADEDRVRRELSVMWDCQPFVDGRQLEFLRIPILEPGGGGLLAILSIARDITERQRLEERLRVSNERHQSFFDSSEDGLVLGDGDIITEVNGVFVELMGGCLRDVVGRSFVEVLSVLDLPVAVRPLLSGWGDLVDPLSFEVELGDERYVSVKLRKIVSGDRVLTLGIFSDITAKVVANQDMIRSETLVALGSLTAGIAHEFNNINSIIRGYLELVCKAESFGDEVRDWLDRVLKAVERSSVITNDLLTYTDLDHGVNGLEPYNIKLLASEVFRLVSKDSLSRGVVFRVDGPDLIVNVNVAKFSVVILNLMLNAIQSMVDVEEKFLSVEVEDRGDWAVLRVIDTGHGIEKCDLDKVFHPFFTTKRRNLSSVAGHGLGLSVVHTVVVDHHKGSIHLESEVGRGTSVEVRIPKGATPLETVILEREESPREGQTILIVDDEVDLRNLLSSLLSSVGYEVFTAGDGEEALGVLETVRPDVAVVDLKMPNMPGDQFIREVRRLGMDFKILVLSGNIMAKEELSGVDISGIISKPFNFTGLVEQIAKVLV